MTTQTTRDPYLLDLYEKVFYIPLTLTSILQNLSATQLIQYRRVNSCWNEISTKILITQKLNLTFVEKQSGSNDDDDHQVFVEERHSADDHHHGDKEDQENFTLQNLTAIMTHECSFGFPCQNFSFFIQNLESPSIHNFLKGCGPTVKILEFNFSGRENRSERKVKNFLCHLLQVEAPNLQILKLNFESAVIIENHEKFDQQPPPPPIKIPKLRHLQFFHNTTQTHVTHDLELDLLKGALNLVSWRGNRIDHVGHLDEIINFVNLRKLHLIQNLSFHPFRRRRHHPVDSNLIQKYEEFSHHFCYLKKLTVDTTGRPIPPNEIPAADGDNGPLENDIKVSILFIKFLEQNTSTLDTLLIVGQLGFLQSCTSIDLLPVMSKVTNLKFIATQNGGGHRDGMEEAPKISLIPNWWSLSSSFPCLSKIVFHSIKFDPESPSNYARQKILNFDPIESVNCLEICPPWPEGPLLILKEKFPNMTRLSVKGIFDFVAVGNLIWKNFDRLQNLKLGFLLDTEFDTAPQNWGWCGTYSFMDLRRGHVGTVKVAKSYPTHLLDATFTGLTANSCKNFLMMASSQENFEEMEKLIRTAKNVSILNLKDLRSLKLNFVDMNDYSVEDTIRLKSTILSKLTGKYAFALMSQLKVTIKATARHPRTLKFMREALRPIHPFVENVSSSSLKTV